jgi:Domain of unknown function (DUF1905)
VSASDGEWAGRLMRFSVSDLLGETDPWQRDRHHSYPAGVDLAFEGEIWSWRGPAPHHFITVPDEESAALHVAAASVTYGWGMIPVAAEIGSTRWTTSLFPKDGGYLVPVKASVRHAEGLALGDRVTVRLTIGS